MQAINTTHIQFKYHSK